MATNLFYRYIWLIDTIYRSGRITFDEINTKWRRNSKSDGNPIPLRTFHNHRAAIEKMFDISIVCDKRTYEYYLDNEADIQKGGVRAWLLNSFYVNNLINESHKLQHRIQFENIPSGQQYLMTIIEAMRDGVKLAVSYQSYFSIKPISIECEPYFVKVFKQRWYVIANSDKIRIYALDRIKDLTVTTNPFKMPTNFNPEAYFADCYGIIHDDTILPQIVTLKFNTRQAQYVRDLPLHHSQEEVETTADFSVFTYFLKPTVDFRQEVLLQGEDVEVLAPESFRSEFKNISESMRAKY